MMGRGGLIFLNPVGETSYPGSHYPSIMMKPDTTRVEDSAQNEQICMKYCGACPSYRQNALDRHQPAALFCSRGTSGAPHRKEAGCFCPACELFTRHSLVIGHFCQQQ